MGGFNFENQGSNTYLVYRVEDERLLDTLTLGMLINNNIGSFAPVVYTQQDAEKYLKYNVTSKVTVQQLWEDTISKKHLVGVLKGIVSAVLNAEEYMIDINSLVLNADRIFVDITTGKTELVCIPMIRKQDTAPDMKALFKEILFAARLNPNENNDYFVKLINFVNSKTRFSIEACKEILDEVSNTTEVKPKAPVQQRSKAQENSTTVLKMQAQQPAPVQNMAQETVKPQSRVHSNLNETSVLQNQPAQPFAVPDAGKKAADVPEEKKTPEAEEKGISWFYLMQHYNKENAALYKEQKAKKKQDKENGKKKEKTKDKTKNKKEKTETSGQTKFAVPGSGAPMSMAIPGQPVPPSQSAAQAVQSDNAFQSSQQPANRTPVSGMYAQPMDSNFVRSKANFGETTVLSASGMGETTVLSNVNLQEPAQRVPYLIRNKNNEKIPLNKPIFRIGKEKSYVDYFIGENTAISRSHANIITRENNYFIVDTNSTNHTYVNGVMIQSNEEVRLVDGTKIRLANEDFEFLL